MASPDSLPIVLAARLSEITPVPVESHRGVVGIVWPGSGFSGGTGLDEWTKWSPGDPVESLTLAVRAVLSGVQDQVMESAAEQWPEGPSGALLEFVRVNGGVVELGYGRDDLDVLVMEPLVIADFVDPAALTASKSWYDDEHTGMSAAHAHFTLIGGDFDPAQVTAALGIEPDHTIKAGDARVSPTGHELGGKHRTSSWMIETDKRLESTSLARHLRLLLDQLEPHIGALLELQRELCCRAEFMCYFVTNPDVLKVYQGPGFDHDLLARIVMLDADLTFDFAVGESEGDEDV